MQSHYVMSHSKEGIFLPEGMTGDGDSDLLLLLEDRS